MYVNYVKLFVIYKVYFSYVLLFFSHIIVHKSGQ